MRGILKDESGGSIQQQQAWRDRLQATPVVPNTAFSQQLTTSNSSSRQVAASIQKSSSRDSLKASSSNAGTVGASASHFDNIMQKVLQLDVK